MVTVWHYRLLSANKCLCSIYVLHSGRIIFITPLLLIYLSYYGLHSMSSIFFQNVLFLSLGIFEWIPNHRLNLPTAFPCRHVYHTTACIVCQYLFFEKILFTRLQKPAKLHKHWKNCMKKSFFVKSFFLLKAKIKVRQIILSAYRV